MDKGGGISFVYSQYIYAVIAAIIIIVFLIIKSEKKFFKWVERHFFFKRSGWSKLSGLSFVIGVTFLLFALLDLRGDAIKVDADIPDQKTIIIIDASSSMLVEDVRPNRFQKAILMARHFVKKSVGHQIAIVLFSDIQKRLVPFTDDLDLLDSRISGLSKMNINQGGSNIDQAIQESIQYFKATAGKKTEISGNLLIFTDSEDNGQGFKLKIPDTVTVAVVGIGTAKGGPIPIRNSRGVFRGYKKYKGQKVISKLDEGYLKKLQRNIGNLKYWIALSYSIPTEEILNFFKRTFKKSLLKGSTTIRPVLGSLLIIPGVLLIALSSLLKIPKSFSYLFVFFMLLNGRNLKAQESEPTAGEEKVKEKKYEKEVEEYLALLREGDLTKEGKLKLGEYYLKDDENEKGLILYEENVAEDERNMVYLFNYGTALLKSKKIKEGLSVLRKIESNIAGDSEQGKKLVADLRKNILTALAQQQQQQKKNKGKKKKNDKNKDKKKEKGKKKNEGSGDSKDQKNSDKKSGKNDKQDKKQDNKKDKKNDKEKKKKKDPTKDNKDKNKKEEGKPKTLEDKENELRKKRKMIKVPAMLKQILNEDRALQEKYFKTNTKNKKSRRDIKDW